MGSAVRDSRLKGDMPPLNRGGITQMQIVFGRLRFGAFCKKIL